MNKIICWILRHEYEAWDYETVYIDGGGWHEIVYSYRCSRCGHVKEYQR